MFGRDFKYPPHLLRALNRMRLVVKHKGRRLCYVVPRLDDREGLTMRIESPVGTKPGEPLVLHLSAQQVRTLAGIQAEAGKARAEESRRRRTAHLESLNEARTEGRLAANRRRKQGA